VGITLLWTMLCQGMDGTPSAKRAIIVCPTSLVSNWDDECNKWYNPVPQTFGQ
jgi:DNA repair and recombination RAD54-like protein